LPLFLDLVYLTGLALLSPLILVRAAFSERWRAGWGHRLGGVPVSAGEGPGVWIHAASVGEVNTARSLVEKILRERPGWRVGLSTNTNTGQKVAQDLFGGRVTLFYFPLDVSFVLRRVLRRIRPDVIVLIEGELWPNLLRMARRRNLPVVLVNGRMREKICRRHRLAGFLYAPLHDPKTRNVYCVQTETYADRFRRAGFPPEKIRVTGTMKYDVVSTEVEVSKREALRDVLGLRPDEPLWIGACTWPGEETICLEAHRRLLEERPSLRLLLAPRHVERAAAVRQEIERMGFSCFRRSEAPGKPQGDAILLLDTVGELGTAYALAECAFVGRSLTARGGHNVMEPAALGVPPVFGPFTENFAEETRGLLEADAAVLVQDVKGLYNAVSGFLRDEALRRCMGDAGRRAVLARRGATQKHLNALAECLEDGPAH